MSVTSILGWLHRRAENIAALILGSMFVSFLVQVLFRYVLNVPLGWTVEYVSIAWLWGILFGYAFVTRDSEIIRLDIVYSAVPTPVQRAMDEMRAVKDAFDPDWTLNRGVLFEPHKRRGTGVAT